MLKTKLEIIDETVEYYSQDVSRRAVLPDGQCRYYVSDGRVCAVGKYLMNPQEFEHSLGSSTSLFSREGINILKKEYRIEDSSFWYDLQGLHDYSFYWTDIGLSDAGIKEVKRLKEAYA
jgi:hypothetical protein